MDHNYKKILTGFFIFIIFLLNLFYFQQKNLLNQIKQIDKKQQQIFESLNYSKNNDFKQPLNNSSENFQLLQEIAKLKREINQLKSQVEEQQDFFDFAKNQTPSEITSPTSSIINNLKFITLNDRKWQQVDVYQDKSSSSKIIGKISYGKYYPFTKKENNYYYIQLENGLYGWVNQQFVKEL